MKLYWVVIVVDVSDLKPMLEQLVVALLISGACSLIALFIISSWLVERALVPVEESWQQQKRFIEDASHELKSPLSAISANMSVLETSPEEPLSNLSEWLIYMRNDLTRMEKLVTDMLILAESSLEIEPLKRTDLSTICTSSLESIQARLDEKNIRLQADIDAEVFVRAEDKITQVITNLLDNAQKYTDHAGTITVTLRKRAGYAVLTIANTGTGISENDLPYIFDRFYRPDSSRSTETGGTGLGLSIAKAIVEQAGGTITVESSPELTTFTVTLKSV